MRTRTVLAVVLAVLATIGGTALGQESDPAPFRVIYGTDRYGTAAHAAEQSQPGHVDVVYIVNGENLADAMIVGGTTGLGHDGAETSKMLLVRTDEVPQATLDAFGTFRACQVVFVGGDEAISAKVRGEVMNTVQRRCVD